NDLQPSRTPGSVGVDISTPGVLAEPLTRTGTFLGTPNYMAPEQLMRKSTAAPSDQFSYCVALYEALYGERPFHGNSVETLLADVVAGSVKEPPDSRGVPSWVRRILLRGLSPNPEDRYPSVDALLQALVEGEERQLGRRARRLWVSGVGGAALVLALVGSGVGGGPE